MIYRGQVTGLCEYRTPWTSWINSQVAGHKRRQGAHVRSLCFFSCDQAALRALLSVRPSVCPSVRLSHLFDNVQCFVSSWNFQDWLPLRDVMSMQKVKVRVRRSRSQRSWPHQPFPFFEVIRQIPRSHDWTNRFDPNWAFPDCNSSLSSTMTMKCYTKLKAA